jgi:hypothetical protein
MRYKKNILSINNARITVLVSICLMLSMLCHNTAAVDWPMRLYDKHRSGITSEQLTVATLTECWRYTTERAPDPAWDQSPAKFRNGTNSTPLKLRENFDYCFDIVAAGDFIYFGSSVSGAVTCLNANTGNKVWTFFTDGPVRLAPTIANGNVYVGSDDGYAYCLDAIDGSLIWSARGGPSDAKLWGNQHMISVWPIRSSLLVDGTDVFWACGLFPEEGLYLCKRNALDGTGGWTMTAKRPPQGYLLATSTQLFVPSGKSYPNVYNRSTGAYVGDVKRPMGVGDNDYAYRDGGCWALLTPDETDFWNGPATPPIGAASTQQFRTADRTYIAAVAGANYLIADSTYAYYNTDTQIVKILRSSRGTVWTVNYTCPYALIKAGNTLFAGGNGQIAAFDTNGNRIWTAWINGKAYGLAAANGWLFASTDTGAIHAFSSLYNGVPGKATSSSPTNGDTSVSITPTLTWYPGFGSSSHNVYFGTASPGTFQGNQTGSTFVPGTLAPNITYYWRIDELNGNGTTTGSVWSFATAAAPEQAASPIPANNTTGLNVTDFLSWTAGNNATSHNIYFGTVSPGTFQGNQTRTTYDPGIMTGDTTYYWRIDEVGNGGTTIGTVWNFTTAVALELASNPAPANGATNVNPTAILSWTAGSNAVSHNVYFSNTSPSTFQGNQIGTTFTPGNMSNNTTYYWRIDEISSSGTTTTGTAWSFTTGVLMPPSTATNPIPANGATGVSTTTSLSWTAGTNAASHNIYFGNTSPGTFQCNQTANTFVPGTLAPNTTYYWRIEEVNGYWAVGGPVWSFTTPLDPNNAADADLVGYWKLNQNGGGICYDETANNNDGTINGSPTWTTGYEGSVINFDGVDDYVDCGSGNSLNITGPITVVGWFKYSSSTYDTTGIEKTQAYRLVVTSNKLSFQICDSGNVWHNATSSSTYNDNTWHHVAGTYDGTAQKLYVDGFEVASLSWNGSIKSTTTTFEIGRRDDMARYYKGLLDEVRVYKRTLSQSEILAIKNQ